VHTITSSYPEGLCIEASDPENAMVQVVCDGSQAQDLSIFRNDVTTTDQIRIGGGDPEKCLGLEADSVFDLDVVRLETCIDGDETQLWERDGERYRNVFSGKCLDVSGGVLLGGELIQYDGHNGDNQKWVQQGPWTPALDPVLMVSGADATITGAFERCCTDWIGVTWGTPDSIDTPGSAATATFEFTVVEAGDYKIEGFTWAQGASNNSFWVTTSLGPEQYEWGTPNAMSVYDYVNTNDGGPDAVITIPANTVFTITVWLREDYSWLKSLELVPV